MVCAPVRSMISELNALSLTYKCMDLKLAVIAV